MAESNNSAPEDHLDTTEEAFFSGKRPWSKIKDQVLRTYLPAYLAKVARLNRKIVLIDAFAGPGRFDDGEAGSPLIICAAAEKIVADRYLAVFVNRNEGYHQQLKEALKIYVDRKSALPILGNAKSLLSALRNVFTNQTVFLYLDPFGLKGCEFSAIEPFLRRDKRYSTEVVINLSVPTMHRLAARKAVAEG